MVGPAVPGELGADARPLSIEASASGEVEEGLIEGVDDRVAKHVCILASSSGGEAEEHPRMAFVGVRLEGNVCSHVFAARRGRSSCAVVDSQAVFDALLCFSVQDIKRIVRCARSTPIPASSSSTLSS